MALQNLKKKFYPPKDVFKTLSIREQEQLSLLVGSNLVFMILFAIFGIVLFTFKYFIVGAGGLFLLAFFAASLTYSRKGHIHFSSWITSIAIILINAVECYGGPFSISNYLPYRDSFFISAMAVCNYVISLRRRQLYVFFGGGFLTWILTNILKYQPLFAANPSVASMNIIICSLGIITVNLCILLFDKFTRRVVEIAEESENKSNLALNKISNVIVETAEGLNIGKQLSDSTAKAANSVEEINELYNYINSETTTLSTEAVTIKDSSFQINDKADQMKKSVQSQSNAITSTSAALNEMSASLTNISSIANDQRAGMNTLVNNLDSQMKLLHNLVNDMMKVKESSDKVSTFVEAVNKISAQTGLLAMNASIEAAHAGSLGKGFSVIASEIRKLSEETTKNAQKITETLEENETIVNATSESVTAFSEYTKTITEELRKTIRVMEEILSGVSEIDTGTRDVMNALTQIVDDANLNTQLAEGVAGEIIQQNSALQNISNGTEQLQLKVSSLEGLLSNIRDAIEEIDRNASANEIVAAKISGALC